jgi:hypothetical protein
MSLLMRLRVVPYWDSLECRTLFRKKPGAGPLFGVTRQAREENWPRLIELLSLHTRDDCARVRQQLKLRSRSVERS